MREEGVEDSRRGRLQPAAPASGVEDCRDSHTSETAAEEARESWVRASGLGDMLWRTFPGPLFARLTLEIVLPDWGLRFRVWVGIQGFGDRSTG